MTTRTIVNDYASEVGGDWTPDYVRTEHFILPQATRAHPQLKSHFQSQAIRFYVDVVYPDTPRQEESRLVISHAQDKFFELFGLSKGTAYILNLANPARLDRSLGLFESNPTRTLVETGEPIYGKRDPRKIAAINSIIYQSPIFL